MESKSNDNLIDFLWKTDNETISDLIEFLDSFFSLNMRKLKKLYQNRETIPPKVTIDRKILAHELSNQLRYFGTHGIYWGFNKILKKEPYKNYHLIVYDVAKSLNLSLPKEYRIDMPRIATTNEYETIICEILLKIQFADKSIEQIREMLKDAGLDKEGIAETIHDSIRRGGSGTLIIGLVKFLGKKALKQLVEKGIIILISKIIGKEFAKEIATKILKDVTQKFIAQFVTGIGVVLIAADIVNLAGPAKRITVPCVSYLSAIRLMENFSTSESTRLH